MRYLLLISTALSFQACTGPYKALRKTSTGPDCVFLLKPAFTTALYNTSVNVAGKHLSGLLIIKKMPDSSIRIVFSNEAGFKFFDFGFLNGEFKVNYIYRDLDKKPVIRTLRKDFQLLLMYNMAPAVGYLLKSDNKNNNSNYYTFPRGEDHYYYITDSLCQHMIRMERGNRRKPVMTAIAENFSQGTPDTIGITHSNFRFDIGLKRIYNYAER